MSLETPVVPHADRTTWAKRNPAANVQASREPTHKLTDAKKAMCKLAAELKKTGQVALNAAVSTYLLEQTEKLNALAAVYNVKVKRIEDMVNSQTHYKKSQAPTLQNAIVHFLAKKVNSYLPVGYRKTLAELKVMAQDDLDVQSFTKDDEENLIIELIEYRAFKKTGVRATNKVASQDILLTLDRVINELDCLADRTGFSTFILGARNSVNDEALPTFHGSGDSMEFFSEVLERDPWELARLFEQWLCKREKSNITNIKRIEMNYTNYETTIVQAHGVKLIGFSLNQFVNPSEVTNITDMQQLHNALRSGECKWIRLLQPELDIHAEGCKACHKDGEVVGKPRKKRCDAGVLRGKQKRAGMDSDKEKQDTLSKKQRTSHLLTQSKLNTGLQRQKKRPKSCEFINLD
ncbi:hypothetical protein BU17DRAFT_71015 [Hysterangium stoloniferum]|nr:hypothetical protein BU17DRAFT_71015 [Hysterangium stoloniferum]